MKDDAILFRIDAPTKKKAQEVARLYGLSLSSVLSSYLHQIAYTGKIPLNLAVHAKREEGEDGVLSLSLIKKVVQDTALTFPEGSFKGLYLFGSYARGEAKEESDVDLLVVPGESLDYFVLGRLNETLRERLGKSVDTTLLTSLDPKMVARIDQEKILLYPAKGK
jgi:addiction module RelB/DinJ family antitoxin